ncbi:universal stress protein [Natronococcus sp. JC468]|uniref:universal stress protein n=1 Tax=Natronococcus sp. JC468 TaxID=1961921 RepID=UPI00143AB7E2|nr:universal stress protein [Natronococcus sp. JC468]NKE37222.1 universal stress protein [Natronococcus sp. JC468]
MTNVLVCVDTDVERARKQANSIVELPLQTDEVEIELYHVFRASDEDADAGNLNSVATANELLEKAGFSVTVSQSSGDATRNILDRATEIDADVISLAGRKRSPTGKVLFGSVTQDVVLKSGRTVLLSTDN